MCIQDGCATHACMHACIYVRSPELLRTTPTSSSIRLMLQAGGGALICDRCVASKKKVHKAEAERARRAMRAAADAAAAATTDPDAPAGPGATGSQ